MGKSLNLQKGTEIRCIQKKKDHCMYETFFHINVIVTTQKKSKTETHTITKEETEEKL